MSRIGKLPVEIPGGVTVNISASEVTVQGPKGGLTRKLGTGVKVNQEESNLVVSLLNEEKQSLANFGTTRAHLQNMVNGVCEPWVKTLELVGVGYNASMSGKKIKLQVGFSHDVFVEVPENVNATVEKTKITLNSVCKDSVGGLAAAIRKVCPPEPYLGKGIRYSDEVVKRKAGKAGAK